jgi:quercetin 2,3-dioxygenase
MQLAITERRGREDLGRWEAPGISAVHHFCYGAYQRPNRMEWGRLRAVNEFRLEPGASRQPAFCSDFEVLTIVRAGVLRRLGSLKSSGVMQAASLELIRCKIGTEIGVAAEGKVPTEFIELWLSAEKSIDAATRETAHLDIAGPPQRQKLLSSDIDQRGILRSIAGADVELIQLSTTATFSHIVRGSRRAYAIVLSGSCVVNSIGLGKGDAIAVADGELILSSSGSAELLLIDVPATLA